MNVAEETLGFRRAGLSPALSLLMSAFALPIPPACLSTHLHRPTERSPTMWQLIQAPSCRRILGPHSDQRLAVKNNALRPLALRAKTLESAATSLASVPSLSPVTSSAQDDSTSELLRFL